MVSTQDVFILRFSDYKSQTYTDTMTLIQKNDTWILLKSFNKRNLLILSKIKARPVALVQQLICMWMKSQFHMVPRLALRKRLNLIRKWPILAISHGIWCLLQCQTTSVLLWTCTTCIIPNYINKQMLPRCYGPLCRFPGHTLDFVPLLSVCFHERVKYNTANKIE